VIFFTVLLLSCSGENALNNRYKSLDDVSVHIQSEIEQNQLNVLLFLSPECPLCQNYAPTIQDIQNSFSDKKVKFFGIVSGDFYSRESILKYKLKYGIDMPILLDPEFKLADQLNAEITPEAVVLNNQGRTIYMGAIDNWAISLGQKRLEASAHYLSDALNNYLEGKKVEPSRTKAVGCFIE
jgi:thiol-disulfide isomerase/thioredoxin